MKIIAGVRTRNEAANIDRFCHCYAWADHILVADGGSVDDTVQRAETYKNVLVSHFTEQIGNKGNPKGKHINFLIDLANENAADWIIFDDCDCVPTVDLQNSLRSILENTDKDIVMLYRLYIKGTDKYFPKMNEPGHSLYAWRATLPIRAWEGNPLRHRMINWDVKDSNILRLASPLSCLHYFCPDEETNQRKLNFYRAVRDNPNAPSPCEESEAHGQLEALPTWAKWKE